MSQRNWATCTVRSITMSLVRIDLNGNFWKMKIWHQVNRVLPLKSKMKCVSFVIKKPATSGFHQLFWILHQLVRLLVGQFWAWHWTSKIHIAAYFLDGTSYSKTYWQPCNYIQLFSLWLWIGINNIIVRYMYMF